MYRNVYCFVCQSLLYFDKLNMTMIGTFDTASFVNIIPYKTPLLLKLKKLPLPQITILYVAK